MFCCVQPVELGSAPRTGFWPGAVGGLVTGGAVPMLVRRPVVGDWREPQPGGLADGCVDLASSWLGGEA